jgi:hypothetical protein
MQRASVVSARPQFAPIHPVARLLGAAEAVSMILEHAKLAPEVRNVLAQVIETLGAVANELRAGSDDEAPARLS